MAFRKGQQRNGKHSGKFKRYFDASHSENDCYTEEPENPNEYHEDHNIPVRRGEKRKHEHGESIDNSMDEESSTYFRIVLERMHEPFEDEEEKDLFLEKVIEEMQGKETAIAMTSLGSRTVQKVLELNTKVNVLERLIEVFRNDLEPLSRNQFSSLALQCLLINCLNNLQNCRRERKIVTDFVLGTADFCVYNFPGILDHPFQNFLLKTIIHILAGNTNFSFRRNQFECEPVFVDVPLSYQEMLAKLSDCILSTDNIEECLKIDRFAFVVQHLLKVASHFSHNRKQVSDQMLSIISKTEVATGELHPLFTNSSSSHVVEAVIEHLDRKQRKVFMKKYVLNNMETIIEHRLANNILKTLIRQTPKKEAFEKLFDKLEPYFNLIFHLERDTLLVAVADCCVKFDVCQARFVIALKNMLRCSEGDKQDYFVLCLLHMLLCEQYIQADAENCANISLNGSLLVQRLLTFSKPIKIVMAIVNLNHDTLKRIACDPKGSHVIDAFMKSPHVGEKSREKLIKKIKEIAITLACNPYGSRSIDTIWVCSNLKHKILLADSLAKNIEILADNKFGKFINRNFHLTNFKKRFEEWKQVQMTQEKKRKMFQTIVNDDCPGVSTW